MCAQRCCVKSCVNQRLLTLLQAESSLQSNFWKDDLASKKFCLRICNLQDWRQSAMCLQWNILENVYTGQNTWFFFSSIYAVSHILMSRLGLNPNTHAACSLLHRRFKFCHTAAPETLLGSTPQLNSAEGSGFFFIIIITMGGGYSDGGWSVTSQAAWVHDFSPHTHCHTQHTSLNMIKLRCDKLLLRLETQCGRI